MLGVGGFLGIGEKSVGVQLDQLTLNQEGDALVLTATREDLENATEVQYETEQTVPEDTRVARLMNSGQQGQTQEQGQAEQQDQTAAAETGAEGDAVALTAEQITTLRGKVLMVSISKENLQQAPSFEQGTLPDAARSYTLRSLIRRRSASSFTVRYSCVSRSVILWCFCSVPRRVWEEELLIANFE